MVSICSREDSPGYAAGGWGPAAGPALVCWRALLLGPVGADSPVVLVFMSVAARGSGFFLRAIVWGIACESDEVQFESVDFWFLAWLVVLGAAAVFVLVLLWHDGRRCWLRGWGPEYRGHGGRGGAVLV